MTDEQYDLSGDRASGEFVNQIRAMAYYNPQGAAPFLSARRLAVGTLLLRLDVNLSYVAPHLPAYVSPNHDYGINQGRYVFALIENALLRGAVGIRLARGPPFRVDIYFLEFIIGAPTPSGVERPFSMHMYKFQPESPAHPIRIRIAPFNGHMHTNTRLIVTAFNHLYNELLRPTSDVAAENRIRGVILPNLSDDLLIMNAMTNGRHLAYVLQLYENVDVEIRDFPGPRQAFFGSHTNEYLALLDGLQIIRTLAELVNRADTDAAAAAADDDNATMLAQAAILEQLKQRTTEGSRLYLALLGFLKDDYGYLIDDESEYSPSLSASSVSGVGSSSSSSGDNNSVVWSTQTRQSKTKKKSVRKTTTDEELAEYIQRRSLATAADKHAPRQRFMIDMSKLKPVKIQSVLQKSPKDIAHRINRRHLQTQMPI